MNGKKRITEFFLLLQLIIYFVGISFAAGGGNHPGLTAGSIIYLKAFCLSVPLIGCMLHTVFNRRASLMMAGSVLMQNGLIVFYIAFAAISIPLAIDPVYCGQRLLYMIFAMGGLFALVIQYANFSVRVLLYDTIIRHMTVLTVISFIFPLFVFVQHGLHDLIPGYRTALQSYLLIHPNLLASFYAHLAVFHAACILYSQRKKLWLQKLCLAILAALIVLLFSRAVFISIAVATVIGGFFLANLYGKKSYLVLPIMIISISAAVALAIVSGMIDLPSVLNPLIRGDDAASMATLTHRTQLWSILFDGINQKIFLVGNGYSVMTKTFGVDFGTGILYGAHNAYFSVLLGTGIFSLLCVISYLGAALLRIIRRRSTLPVFAGFSMIASLTIFAVNCLVSDEIGVSVTVTFAYLFFMLNMLVYDTQRAGA